MVILPIRPQRGLAVADRTADVFVRADASLRRGGPVTARHNERPGLSWIAELTGAAPVRRTGEKQKEVTMGLFEQMTELLGGGEPIERFAKEQGNFEDAHSQDFQHWGRMLGAAPQEDVEEAMTHAARGVDEREYYEHITPGVRGTDPLGQLGGDARGMLAGSLLESLTGGSGLELGQLLQLVPGLQTTDPQRMSPQEVASLAHYTRQHYPDAFGRVAAQVGRQEPGLLQQLLGNKTPMRAAAGLAAKFLAHRSRG